MHSKSDNIETMISDVRDGIIGKLFNSLKNSLLFYYKCYKVNINRGGPYIDSSD